MKGLIHVSPIKLLCYYWKGYNTFFFLPKVQKTVMGVRPLGKNCCHHCWDLSKQLLQPCSITKTPRGLNTSTSVCTYVNSNKWTVRGHSAVVTGSAILQVFQGDCEELPLLWEHKWCKNTWMLIAKNKTETQAAGHIFFSKQTAHLVEYSTLHKYSHLELFPHFVHARLLKMFIPDKSKTAPHHAPI